MHNYIGVKMGERITTIVGNKEYQFSQIGVFEKSKLFAKIQALIVPAFAGSGIKLDSNATTIIAALSERITPELLDEVVMPMFKLAQVASIEHQKKIDSPAAVNACFDDMDDFFTLVFEVAKENFLPSLKRLMENFGGKDGIQKAMA